MGSNYRTRSSARLVAGTGVVAAVLIGISSITFANAPRPAQDDGGPNQQTDVDATEYVGGGASVGGVGVDESASKAEGLGPIGASDGTTPDVPGQSPADDAVDMSDATQQGSTTTSPEALEEIRAAIAESGSARVNVMTNLTVALEADLAAADVTAQQSAVAASLDALDASLAGTGSTLVSRLQSVPVATYTVTQAGVDALLANAAVSSMALDGYANLTLDVSTGVIDSDLLNLAGVAGNNFEGSTGFYEVAVLDSGVDNQHAAFTGRIHDQACFSSGFDCPNASNVQIGGNAGDNCTYTPVTRHCEHGTHVAGIAAGNFYSGGGHEGVARGARIIAVQIGSNGGGTWGAAFSDINAGLQHVLNLRNAGHRVVAVNMSIGIDGFAQNSNCDANNANFQATQNVAAQLQAAGVAVIAAAGNSNLVGASYPACLSSVFSISATDDVNNVAGFTNSGATTTWWAPGVSINAPIPGTGAVPAGGYTTRGNKSGTSMSSPHVAGAWSLMRECIDPATEQPMSNSAIAGRFNVTGVNITDNGATRRRINVLDAATGTVNNNDFAFAENLNTIFGGPSGNDIDWTVCSDTERGEPTTFSLDNGIWWTWTAPATGSVTISTEDGPGQATTFDTTLAVYTGATLGTLQTVAADDDSGTGLRSLVTIGVNAGTTYRIRVDGFGAANGRLNLAVSPVTPIQCFGVNATIVGNASNDVINGTAGNDVIAAGAGNDTVNSLAGNDQVCGDAGNDSINTAAGADFVLGGSGADTIAGGTENDTLVGNPGFGGVDDSGDVIRGEAGDDYIDGWVGDDRIFGGLGNDEMRGEAGIDFADYGTSATPIVANLFTQTATGEGSDTYSAIENVSGSPFNDAMSGNNDPNVLLGGGGNDVIDGHPGNDVLNGGSGDDHIRGRAGNDSIDGSFGFDFTSYAFTPNAVIVDLTAGTATGDGNDTILNSEHVFGSTFNDTIVGNVSGNNLLGNNGNDILRGGGSNDVLDGQAGNDLLDGGAGNDTMLGRLGNDTYLGGVGLDTASFQFSPAIVNVNLTAGTATGEGVDSVLTSENVVGSAFNDTIIGNALGNTLRGMNGNDTVRGAGANDAIAGGNGNDNLFGEDGNDFLAGEAGNDLCNGGAGTDTANTCEVLAAIP